ncbi:TRAP transporter large permease [Marinomonas sp. GJ51-6]|nr:TRAP transporter large permease [Marinomonas sp. GJ51-6]WOD08629.1 TRAP transporter large permease [Marinomonas sp. GJ51-6]
MIPRLVERGYDRNYAVSLVACSSVLALLIPPSASMIIFGWVTNTSITALFLAPILPGFLLIMLFMFWNRVLTRNMPIKAPEPVGFVDAAKIASVKAKRAAFGLAMPLIILGCIYGGVTTPTEAAAIAVVYAIPVGFLIYRDLNWKSFYDIVWKSAQTSGVLMVLIFFASMLARLFTMENVPQDMMGSFLAVTENKILLLLMINLFLVVIGMFMDDVSGILLVSPMLLPIMLKLGVDPIHFGAIVAVNLGMGLITPPTAPILYFAAMVGGVKLGGILKPTLVFVLFAYLPVVLLTTFLPDLSMALPRLILGLE